jgi:hypothetical protein
MRMRERHQKPDLITLQHELLERGDLEFVGGPAALALIYEDGALNCNVQQYVEIVEDLALKRALDAESIRFRAEARNGFRGDEVLSRHLVRMEAIRAAVKTEPVISVRPISESLASPPSVIRYVVPPIIPEAGLTVLSAAPGVGKGRFVQRLLVSAAAGAEFMGVRLQPRPGCFLSYEQGAEEDDRVWLATCRGAGVGAADFEASLVTISQPPMQLDDARLLDQICTLAAIRDCCWSWIRSGARTRETRTPPRPLTGSSGWSAHR